ncbi:MAG: GldM family protein [Weeksellaceae bacterium]
MAQGGGKAARQKMINLMYIVFIAMMAMNVDRQVLRSFEDITVALDDSSKLTDKNNSTFYENIIRKAGENPDYVEIRSQAAQVKEQSDKAYHFIEGIRKEIMDMQEYDLPEFGADMEGVETNYSSLSNVDVFSKVLFREQDKPTEKGDQLVSIINSYKDFMAGIYPDQQNKDRINHVFNTDNQGKRSWLHTKFYEQPMVAGLANLTKIQSDIRTEEGNLVRALLANKLDEEIQLKAYQPIVMVPPFVRSDKPADASIAFGAFDNNLQGKVTIDGIGEIDLVDGVANFKLNTAGSGQKIVSGTMTYYGPDGKWTEPIPFSQEYEVVAETIAEMPSGAVITADKMNVVYRNLDNPITATVNGADGPVSMRASVAGLRPNGAGKWIFKPAAGSGEVKFTASAKTSTGKVVEGSTVFRIKPVPPARAQIAGKTSIAVPKEGIAGQTVRVDWPDFLFDVEGQVTSFKVKVPGQPTVVVNGNKLSEAAGTLAKARKGDVVGIFDIKYDSNAGTGSASSVTIEVN